MCHGEHLPCGEHLPWKIGASWRTSAMWRRQKHEPEQSGWKPVSFLFPAFFFLSFIFASYFFSFLLSYFLSFFTFFLSYFLFAFPGKAAAKFSPESPARTSGLGNQKGVDVPLGRCSWPIGPHSPSRADVSIGLVSKCRFMCDVFSSYFPSRQYEGCPR